nr:MAG TPA: hypothetical protein [Caudoviricetes sp.]
MAILSTSLYFAAPAKGYPAGTALKFAPGTVRLYDSIDTSIAYNSRNLVVSARTFAYIQRVCKHFYAISNWLRGRTWCRRSSNTNNRNVFPINRGHDLILAVFRVVKNDTVFTFGCGVYVPVAFSNPGRNCCTAVVCCARIDADERPDFDGTIDRSRRGLGLRFRNIRFVDYDFAHFPGHSIAEVVHCDAKDVEPVIHIRVVSAETKTIRILVAADHGNLMAFVGHGTMRIKAEHLAPICTEIDCLEVGFFEIGIIPTRIFADLELQPEHGIRIVLIAVKRTISAASDTPRTIIPRASLNCGDRTVGQCADPGVYASSPFGVVPVIIVFVPSDKIDQLLPIWIIVIRLNIPLKGFVITARVMKADTNRNAGGSARIPR